MTTEMEKPTAVLEKDALAEPVLEELYICMGHSFKTIEVICRAIS